MNELLQQVLVNKTARTHAGAMKIAQAVPAGEAWEE